MKSIIYKILVQHYDSPFYYDSQFLLTAEAITDLIKEFVIWKDSGDHPYLPYFDIVKGELRLRYTDGAGEKLMLDDIFNHWYNEIYIKND